MAKHGPEPDRHLQAYARSEFLPKRSILLTELLEFGLQILVGHGSPAAFVTIASGGCSFRCGVAARAQKEATARKANRRLPVSSRP